MNTTMAVSDSWLDFSGTCVTTTDCVPVGSNYVYADQWYTYPWYTYPVYYTSPARPIKLTLTEAETLRAAAAKNKALKAVLQKFTPQIEIEIDFP